MTIARQLAQLEGSVAAHEGRPHSANPYGPSQWGESLSWSHGWLVETVSRETGETIISDKEAE